MASNIKFSIIVPIYNVEEYLNQCIDSILVQTYKNYEIILVDDGSFDKSSSICDKYSNKYSFIHTIHKENGGLSDARNVGLFKAIGEYVIFLDSDDFWNDKDFLKNVIDIILNEDVVIINSYKFYETENIENGRFRVSESFNKLNDENKIKYVIKNNIYKACAWDKIIKRRILIDNNIKFPINMLSEDMLWAGNLITYINKINIYEKPVYAYRQRNNSISKKVSEKHLEDIIFQIKEGIKNKNIKVLNYFAYEYCILLAYSCITKNKKIINQIHDLDWLLEYNISNKVKQVHTIYKLFGFEISRKLLFEFLKIKERSHK